MQIVIEIPNKVYGLLKYFEEVIKLVDEKEDDDVKTILIRAVVNGTPLTDTLNKIRAEIEGYKSSIDNAISEDEIKIEGLKEAYLDCLKIIDKYKAESEE